MAGQPGVNALEVAVPVWLSQSGDVLVPHHLTADRTAAATENAIKSAPLTLVMPVV